MEQPKFTKTGGRLLHNWICHEISMLQKFNAEMIKHGRSHERMQEGEWEEYFADWRVANEVEENEQ